MASGPYSTKGGGFEVRWREGRKHRSRTFNPVGAGATARSQARAAAVAFKEEIERAELTGGRILTRQDVPTLEEFVVTYLARKRLTPETRENYASVLATHALPYIGHLSLLDCRPRRLEEWRDDRIAGGAATASLAKAQAVLHGVFKMAVRMEYLPVNANPMTGMELPEHQPRESRWLTARQVEALRSYYLRRSEPDVGSATLVSVLGYIGIRPQDALGLEIKHIGEKLQVVQRNVNGRIVAGQKSGAHKRRAVTIPDPVRADLENWLSITGMARGLLFPRADGRPWTKSDYSNWSCRNQRTKAGVRVHCFRRAAEAAELGQLVPYDLRHTAATLMIACGSTVAEVAHQLGHSIQTSTRVYQHHLEEAEGVARRPISGWIMDARAELVRSSFGETAVIAS